MVCADLYKLHGIPVLCVCRMPPGALLMMDHLSKIRSGIWRLNFELTEQGCERFFDELVPFLDKTKSRILAHRKDKAYHLIFIGTRAESRGAGYCSRLMEPMMAKVSLRKHLI